jgi:hypothetical protein
MPLLAGRTVLFTVAKVDDKALHGVAPVSIPSCLHWFIVNGLGSSS